MPDTAGPRRGRAVPKLRSVRKGLVGDGGCLGLCQKLADFSFCSMNIEPLIVGGFDVRERYALYLRDTLREVLGCIDAHPSRSTPDTEIHQGVADCVDASPEDCGRNAEPDELPLSRGDAAIDVFDVVSEILVGDSRR